MGWWMMRGGNLNGNVLGFGSHGFSALVTCRIAYAPPWVAEPKAGEFLSRRCDSGALTDEEYERRRKVLSEAGGDAGAG